ncbi:T9SS type B sorting domain-containing protein [Nibribacter ruber]|uniref:T9SS type B sorting domain-containing protein n=1 Tax=Nibribacter ruber TaxID=2698458 RepID=A0A6P1NT44_9BACT|nr:gliding motility-associated C-terminal domain-containing protein [Nibribacter ruber]QHL86887.1 T9SS type B sorting domain-containing protein [Nibribacter ruber]
MPLKRQGLLARLGFLLGLFAFLLFSAPAAQATHIRAGNIFAKSDTTAARNPLRFFFKLVTYTVAGGIEDEQATLYFGDCSTPQTSVRASRVLLQNGENNTLVNTYFFEHTYSGDGTFTVSFIGENRNASIINLSNSVQQSFFLTSTVTIDQFLGINRSPVLLVPPIDVADINNIFVHNPGAYDEDGDSLVFRMFEPRIDGGRDACGNPIATIAPGYRGLENFLGIPVNSGAPFFRLDPVTGQITWNTPGVLGEFNIAFVVEEWRNKRLIGRVVRDMQILVKDIPNRPPRLFVPRDTCIIAGTRLRDTIIVTDPDRHKVNVSAFGEMLPPATFTKASTPDTAYVFNWQTLACLDVRRQPYQVTFRAVDIPPAGVQPLVDIQPWRITVIGPPPVLTTAVVQSSNTITINWQAYNCVNASRIYIYRKEGPSTFVPGYCETGIPASSGFVRVGQVNANATTFTDTNNGQGLPRNKTYCYRIYVEFGAPGGGESLASNEVCATLESLAMTKVSVTETSTTTGKMRVEWNKPKTLIDQLPGPYRYRLLRALGQGRGPAAVFTEVRPNLGLNDTIFVDNGLNTQDTSYIYRVELYRGDGAGAATVLADSASASSVRLTAKANGTSLILNWTYNVPWDNAQQDRKYHHVIYLKKPGGNFERYDSVAAGPTSGTYTKNIPLLVGEEYCAYVVTKGTYQNPLLPDPILNNSQIACLVQVCKPIVTLDPCPEITEPTNPPFQNVVSWTLPEGCNTADIALYTVYYKAKDDDPFQVIGTTKAMTFTHTGLQSFAGCYAVTATDVTGNTSVFEETDVACKDNCIVFILPNIFTPNNDGVNDVFTPKQGAAFIKSARLKVFSRWGNKVFEGNSEPGLNWKGVDDGGKALADGTYFYQVEVEFYGRSSTPDVRVFKGWVEIIH